MTTTWSITLWLEDLATVEHETVGLEQVLWQYQDKPRLLAFLTPLLEEIDRLEHVLFELLACRSVRTAIGVQIDVLGRIVRQLRGGMADDEYRLFLLGRIFVNRMNGRLPEFLELLSLLGVPAPIRAYEFYPAAFELSATGMDYPEAVGELLFDGKPGGVQLFWASTTYDDDDVFKTSSVLGADEPDADEGTENLAGTTGGRLMSLRWTR